VNLLAHVIKQNINAPPVNQLDQLTAVMGQKTSTIQTKVKAIQGNKARVTEVSFDRVVITEKIARKIADGLRENK